MRFYRTGVVVFAVTFVAIGVALVVGAAVRGRTAGYVVGPLFVALGLGRLYLVRRR